MARNLLADEPVTQPRNLLADEVPIPRQQPAVESAEGPDRRFDIGKIPESTAYGTVFGAVAPEILQKVVSPTLQAFPYTRPLGVGTYVAGEALKGRRLASAFTGGVEGGTGETAVQLSKALGAPEWLQTTAGLAVGAGTPTLLGALGRNISLTRDILREAERGGFKEAGERFAARIRGEAGPQDIAAQQRVIAALEAEANSIRQTGQQRANEIMSNAEAEIARLAPGAEQQADLIRQRARDEAAATLFAARQQIEKRAAQIRQAQSRGRAVGMEAEATIPQARQAIGQPAEASDIGQSLRDRIVQVQGDRLSARKKQIDADKDDVIKEVSEKQTAGNFVENMPEYKALLNELKIKAGIGLTDPLKAERDPGTVAALSNLYKSLTKRQVERTRTVIDPETGKQKIEAFADDIPTGFDAIDTIRRKLGDAYRNPQAEGYGAIGQQMAKDYYKRLSEILGNYSPAKKNLIANYEELSRELDIFKGAAGRKATAVDRYDPTRFQTDPASLPSEYFATRQSVRDLIELTGGDRNLVEQQARAYVARQLQTATDANQVRNFVDRNSDWLREFPQLQASVNQFADTLTGTARRTGRLGELEKTLRTELKALPRQLTEAQKKATQITKAGEAEAKAAGGIGADMRAQAGQAGRQAQAEANRAASMLTRQTNQSQVAFFDELATKGDTPRLLAAAPVIKSNPEVLNNFVEGIKISISRLPPDQMADRFLREIQPSLLQAGLLTDQQARQIADQVRLVAMTADPSAVPIRTANLIKSAIVSQFGMGTSRLMDTLGLSFTEPYLGGQ